MTKSITKLMANSIRLEKYKGDSSVGIFLNEEWIIFYLSSELNCWSWEALGTHQLLDLHMGNVYLRVL